MSQEQVRRSGFDRGPSGFGDREDLEIPDIRIAMDEMSKVEKKTRDKKRDEETKLELKAVFDRCRC